jgi:hypothetical protein
MTWGRHTKQSTLVLASLNSRLQTKLYYFTFKLKGPISDIENETKDSRQERGE